MMNGTRRCGRGFINRPVHNRESKADGRSGQDERQAMHCTDPFPQDQAFKGLMETTYRAICYRTDHGIYKA